MSQSSSLLALLHLASPQLPVGGFSYSQALEAAVDAGPVHNASSAQDWIEAVFANTVATWELPTLAHMHLACTSSDAQALAALNAEFIASRETRELREETLQMGWSLRALVATWPQCAGASATLQSFKTVCYPAAFAAAAHALGSATQDCVTAYAFAWVENQLAAAVKAVPLGQTAGQRILLAMHPRIEQAARDAVQLPLSERSSFAPIMSALCARHETQYSRLFRS
jgi:urease accessory protein